MNAGCPAPSAAGDPRSDAAATRLRHGRTVRRPTWEAASIDTDTKQPGGLGTGSATALYVTAVVGPGILTLPAAAARTAGPLSLVALAALLVISVPAAFAFAQIHRAVAPSGGGGIQEYVTAAFGPAAGRIVAAWFYLGVPIGVPALALIGGAYVRAAVGGDRSVELAVAWTIAVVAVLANLRARGSNELVSLLLAIVLVALLVGTAILSVPHWRPGTLRPFAPKGVLAVVPAALTLTWVLTGWEASTNFVGLVRDPHRRLPRVIGLTLIVVVLLYACVAVPELLVLGPFAGGPSAPVAAVLQRAVGAPAAGIAAVLAAVLALANSVAYLASLRQSGVRFLGAGSSPRNGAWRPLAAPVLIVAAGMGLATVTDVDPSRVVELCAGSQIPVYVVALASGLVVVPRLSRGWWVTLVATAAVALLLVPAGPFLLVPAVIAVGVLVQRALTARVRSRPSGS